MPFRKIFSYSIFQILFFFVLAFLIFYVNCSFSWSIFSERDISRARGWLEGNFYWPGPEMTGGNNLPGPFFYFLLFPAILIGDNTYSQVALWTMIWFALTYTVAFFFISKITSHKESLLIFLVTFTLSIHTTNYSAMLNPEFAVLFHVLTLIGLYYWREKRSDLYLYLTSLVITLGIQVHLLVVLHVITVLLFYIIDKPERKKIKSLLLFLILAFSSIFIYSFLKYFHVVETSGNYYGEHIDRILRSIFSEKWFKHIKRIIPFFFCFGFCFILSAYRSRKWKTKIVFQPSTWNLLVIIFIPFLTGFLLARFLWYTSFISIFSIIFLSKWLDDFIPNDLNKRYLLFLIYSFLTSICVLIFNQGYVVTLNFYKLIFIENNFTSYILCLLFFILLITHLQWRKQNFYRNVLFCFLICVSTQLPTLSIFQKSKKPVKYFFSNTWPSYKQLYPLMERIYLETKWTPEVAMTRIFNIGIHPERSLLTDYAMVMEKLNKSPSPSLPILDQGYFLVQHLKKFIGWNKKDWKSYLSKSSLLVPILIQEIKEEKIIIQDPKLYDSVWLIPYKIREDSLFPEAFHNIGSPYYWIEPEWLQRCNRTQTFKNDDGFFYCKVLPGHLQRAGLNIQFSEIAYNNSTLLLIQYFGILLSIPSLFSNLDGASMWIDMSIYLECSGRVFHRTLPNLGYLGKELHVVEKTAKIFLAPLTLQIPLNGCEKNSINKIKLTFTETHSHRNKESIVLEWK